MNIAIDVRSLMEGRHSGVEEYTIEIIRGMLRVAPEHTYHLFYNAARPVTLPEFSGNVRIHRFRYPNKLLNLSQFALAHPRWDRLVPADCFFVPSLRLMPLSPTVPLVTTVHDLSFERFPEFFSAKRRAWHRLMRPRALVKNSDHIIAVSHATKEDVKSIYDVPDERISVVYSGVPPSIDVPTSVDIRTVRDLYHLPAKYILFFGTLEPRKNIPSLIRAFDAIAADIPQHLVIAGARGWLTNEIDEAVAAATHRDRIHVPGFIAEHHKAALYGGADLFVYPSFYEGFGFPPLEALLAGTPVITSYNSSLPEVVGEWATLIDPYNPGELALVMKEVIREPPLVTAKIRQAICQKYSWDHAAEKVVDILQKV